MANDDVDVTGLSEAELAALRGHEPPAPGELEDLQELLAAEEETAKEGEASGKPAPAAEINDDLDTPAIDVDFDPLRANERLATIDAQRRELARKFKDGEVTFDEYTEQRDLFDDERTGILSRAAIAESVSATVKNKWDADVSRFQREHPEYAAPDGRPANPVLYAALDGTVKMLANDPANANRSGAWFLREAHRMVQEQAAPRATPGRKAEPRGHDRRQAAATAEILDRAREDTRGGADEFAHLDKLDGLELEAAVAEMTPLQQERWARGA